MDNGTLPNDVARCEGVGHEEDGALHWREGCEDCLRRTSKSVGATWFIYPPKVIAFWCAYRIEPKRN